MYAIRSYYDSSSTGFPSLTNIAAVTTGKVKIALLRSPLNHFMKYAWSFLTLSHFGFFIASLTRGCPVFDSDAILERNVKIV